MDIHRTKLKWRKLPAYEGKKTGWKSMLQRTKAGSGTTLAELIVAGFLLISGMSLVAQGAVKSYRLHQESRHYQLAYDELANQLERLTLEFSFLSAEECATTLKSLEISEPIQTILAKCKLSGSLSHDESHGGDWLQLTIDWDRGGPSKPLSLVGWIRPNSSKEVSP